VLSVHKLRTQGKERPLAAWQRRLTGQLRTSRRRPYAATGASLVGEARQADAAASRVGCRYQI
jgi:hypothetical protein